MTRRPEGRRTENLQFPILEITSIASLPKDVTALESGWKTRLQTRKWGLNDKRCGRVTMGNMRMFILYAADQRRTEISGQPLKLAAALARIANRAARRVNMTGERDPASAVTFIVNPLPRMRMAQLFAARSAPRDCLNRLAALARTRIPGFVR